MPAIASADRPRLGAWRQRQPDLDSALDPLRVAGETRAICERQQTYLAQAVPVTLAQVNDWSYRRRM